MSSTCQWPAYLNQSRLFLKTMQKEILTQLAILRVGSCANNLPWPYDWLLFCRCDWCDSGCWGKQIKTYQCSCWTDVDGGFDVSLDDSFCNVSSFSFPNIEYFFCCFETQSFGHFLTTVFLKMFQNKWTTGCSLLRATPIHSCNSWYLSGHISLLWKVLCHL